MRSVLLLRSSVTLNYSEIHRSFLKSSVMASRDSVPQWSPGSTGPSVVWPEILSPQWRVKSISLPLEFGLDHETTWSSGTLSNMMHRLKKHLMHWDSWNPETSCEQGRAGQVEDERPCGGEPRHPGHQPARWQSCEWGHPRSTSHQTSTDTSENPLIFVPKTSTSLDSS